MSPRNPKAPVQAQVRSVPSAAAAGPPGDLQVLTRSAQILRHLGQSEVPLRAAEIAPIVGLTRTTAHRYLTSLEAEGFLARDQNGGYGIGPLLVELGAVAMSGQRVTEVAGEYLEELSTGTQHTAVLSLWGGIGPVVANECVPSHQLVKISIQVGSRLPLESAQGLVFLGFMADGDRREQLLSQLGVRKRAELADKIAEVTESGFAVDDRVSDGIRVIAAPVLDASGQICATVGLVGTIHALTADRESTAALSLLDTARRLSRALGFAKGRAAVFVAVPGASAPRLSP